MKIRLTLMTENNKHIDGKTKEEIERITAEAWNHIFGLLCLNSESEDKMTVESCELVEN